MRQVLTKILHLEFLVSYYYIVKHTDSNYADPPSIMSMLHCVSLCKNDSKSRQSANKLYPRRGF